MHFASPANVWILADVILAPLTRVSSCSHRQGCQAPGWVRKLSSVLERQQQRRKMSLVVSLAWNHCSKASAGGALLGRGSDDELLSPVLLLPLLQSLSFCTSMNTYSNNKKTLCASSGTGWRGLQEQGPHICGAASCSRLVLEANSCSFWCDVFASLILSAIESLFLQPSGRAEEDKGKRNPTQRICVQTFLIFAPRKCCIMFSES